MKTSSAGTKAIIGREHIELVAYRDGGGVPTIGAGHTKGVKMGQRITMAQAQAFLRQDLADSERDVNHAATLSKVPFTQGMFDALVSFQFNTGGLLRSTVLKRLEAGDKKGAANALLMWNKDNGRVVKGLVNRRAAERQQFLSP